MLSTLYDIVTSTIFGKLGDWVLEIYKIITSKKVKDKENPATVVVTVIQNSQPSTSSQPAEPSPGVILPTPPVDNNTSSNEPPLAPKLPSSAPKGENEPEFGTDEYITELLKAVYKSKRSKDEFRLGLGNTDELRDNKGEQE